MNQKIQIDWSAQLAEPVWQELQSLWDDLRETASLLHQTDKGQRRAELDFGPRLVGGIVRQALWAIFHPDHPIALVRPLPSQKSRLDIDIAVVGRAEDWLAELSRRGWKIGSRTGLAFASFGVTGQFADYEITSLRQDRAGHGRFATVQLLDATPLSWQLDARRRDFTINAVYADRDGNLSDDCGGTADLQQGIVRFIGNPRQRMQEDIVRLLRFWRFSALYSLVPLEQAMLDLATELSPMLLTLSSKRLARELRLVLANPLSKSWLLSCVNDKLLLTLATKAGLSIAS